MARRSRHGMSESVHERNVVIKTADRPEGLIQSSKAGFSFGKAFWVPNTRIFLANW